MSLAIVVVRGRAFHYERGRVQEVANLPAGLTDDLGRLLDGAALRLHGSRAGTLIVDAPAATLRLWGGQRDALAEAGWTCASIEPWTTWRHAGRPLVHVGLLPELGDGPLFGPRTPPGEIARRLAQYHMEMGGPWFMTAGVAGNAIIRARMHRPGREAQPYWGVKDVREPTDLRQGCGDLLWRRRPTRAEVAAGWVHAFDLRAARLAAMGVASLPWMRLRHTGSVPFDPEMAGYWQVRGSDVAEHPRHPPLVPAGVGWVTTPIMEELMNRGRLPEAIDSWTAPGKRIFRALAEQWDKARLAAEAAAVAGLHVGAELEAIKATYRESAGMFAHPGGSIYRPEWYHTIMDRQRVTVLSHVRRIAAEHGRRPVAIHTDCLWYVDDQDDAEVCAKRLGIELGAGLGRFRPHSSATIADHYRKGQP